MLSEDLQTGLAHFGITNFDEVSLREALEVRIETYTLYKLAPWPARRWKCHYRLMMRDQMYDAQFADEAYARALLASFENPQPSPATSGE